MFRGLGKFSLLLAAAALVVVSCGQNQGASPEKSGDSASQNWPKAVSNPVSATPEEIGILPYDQTQKIVSQVRLDPDVIAAVRDVGGVDWKNRAFAVQKEEGTAVVVWPADTDARLVAVFLDPSAELLDPLRIVASSMKLDPINAINPQQFTVEVSYHTGDQGEKIVYEMDLATQELNEVDWAPIGVFHHPVMPPGWPDGGVCQMAEEPDPCDVYEAIALVHWDNKEASIKERFATLLKGVIPIGTVLAKVAIGSIDSPICEWVFGGSPPDPGRVVCSGVVLAGTAAIPVYGWINASKKVARATKNFNDSVQDYFDCRNNAGLPPDVCNASSNQGVSSAGNGKKFFLEPAPQ